VRHRHRAGDGQRQHRQLAALHVQRQPGGWGAEQGRRQGAQIQRLECARGRHCRLLGAAPAAAAWAYRRPSLAPKPPRRPPPVERLELPRGHDLQGDGRPLLGGLGGRNDGHAAGLDGAGGLGVGSGGGDGGQRGGVGCWEGRQALKRAAGAGASKHADTVARAGTSPWTPTLARPGPPPCTGRCRGRPPRWPADTALAPSAPPPSCPHNHARSAPAVVEAIDHVGRKVPRRHRRAVAVERELHDAALGEAAGLAVDKREGACRRWKRFSGRGEGGG
jgi:hypothetical protein